MYSSGSIGGGYNSSSNGNILCDSNSVNVGAMTSETSSNRVKSANSSASSSGGSTGRTCWSLRKSNLEGSSSSVVASDNSQNVVVTAINTFQDHQHQDDTNITTSTDSTGKTIDRPSSVALMNHNHQKTSSSSLSLTTLDSSRYA